MLILSGHESKNHDTVPNVENQVSGDRDVIKNESKDRTLRHIRTYPFIFDNARPNLKTEKLLKENVKKIMCLGPKQLERN